MPECGGGGRILKLEVAKHIREEGNEKLLLLIAFDLPFDEIADVHHCRDKKAPIRSLKTKSSEEMLQSDSPCEFMPQKKK